MTTELQGLLERVVRLLDRAGVPFMIAGSFASTAHGLPRTTQDLNLVVDPSGPEALDAFVRSESDRRDDGRRDPSPHAPFRVFARANRSSAATSATS